MANFKFNVSGSFDLNCVSRTLKVERFNIDLDGEGTAEETDAICRGLVNIMNTETENTCKLADKRVAVDSAMAAIRCVGKENIDPDAANAIKNTTDKVLDNCSKILDKINTILDKKESKENKENGDEK